VPQGLTAPQGEQPPKPQAMAGAAPAVITAKAASNPLIV
jgi:hypothetical protein